MTYKDIKIYIVACDKYRWLLKPFCYLFNKFWGKDKEVVILGYELPDFDLPDNFTFESMGEDPGPDNWSNGIINYIKNTTDSHFILALDDMALVGDVNFEKLDKLMEYCQNDKVGRICLIRDTVNRTHKLFETIDDDFSIIEATQDVDYRISTCWSIWNKDYFLKNIESNISPWTFEGEASKKAMWDGYHILGTKSKKGPPDNSPLEATNLIWRGEGLNFGKINCPHLGHEGKLEYEVIKEMREKDIIPKSMKCGVVYERRWSYYE